MSNISPYSYCQTGNPIGGGTGYDAILSSSDADIHITSFTTPEAFRTTIEGASVNDVIFIDGGLTIDLTGITPASAPTIDIPAGVTIASDRGTTTGALIKTDDMDYLGSGYIHPAFRVLGTGVRFTGIRFQGPYGEAGVNTSDYDRRKKWGISSHYNNTEIDNCELYNWPRGAVVLSNYTIVGEPDQWSEGHLVHHNYIHNNKQNGFGYGVDVQFAEATIYANIFEENRHGIAGRGEGGSNYTAYEAYCNTVRIGGTHHNFDMHGRDEGGDNKVAGKFIYIHHNDFEDIGAARSGVNNEENIRIGGVPDDDVTVTFNRFGVSKTSFHLDLIGDTGTWNHSEQSGEDQAFQQRGAITTPLNVVWNNNTYNGAALTGQEPIITLTGDSVININVGGSYTELGATWIDPEDGTGAATVGGDTVDENTIGVYVVTYNHTDTDANAATEVIRTVNVVASNGFIDIKKIQVGSSKSSVVYLGGTKIALD